jgi:nucleotide-binding universal stress UspA family protein
MFQRILVPLDGSKRAERAIPVAARLARASVGSVVLLRAISTPIEFWPSLAIAEARMAEAGFDADRANVEKYLADITRLPALHGVPTETEIRFGPPAPIILAVAHAFHTDLIVMCSHGYTGMTHWVLGSVAEKVSRHATIPVFVLRESGPIPADPHPDLTRPMRALISLDGSSHAKAALEPAAWLVAALAAPAQGALHLVRVVQPLTPTIQRGATEHEEKDSEGREEFLHRAKHYLSSTVEHLRKGLTAPSVANLKLSVTWSVAVDTDVASALIRVAENGEDAEGAGVFGGCDLIAMATHGYGGIERWGMGSITARVLSATRLPLLIVRPPDLMDKSHVNWDAETLSALQG